MLTLGVALITALAGPITTDTTLVVPAGMRLDVHGMAGQIVVRTWSRDEVRIQADHGPNMRIAVSREGSVVQVRAQGARSANQSVSYDITVPPRMDLSLGGVNLDIDVEGTRGQVEAETVNGNIRVIGGTGVIDIETVQGNVEVEASRGNVEAASVSGNVTLRNVQGSVEAGTVSGRVIMEQIASNDLVASSVSGSIFFDGLVANDGRYSFSSHSGPITLALPDAINATVTVAQMRGSLISSFGVLQNAALEQGRRQSFTIGNGAAMIETETFSGRIRVAKRGEVRP